MEEAGARVLAQARKDAFFGSGAAEQRQQFEQLKQRAWRENAWGLWRSVGAWTAEPATFLLAGYDPDRAERVRGEFLPAEARAFSLHEAKVHALCAGLRPARRHALPDTVLFKPKPLIEAAAQQDIGYAREIREFMRRAESAQRRARGPSIPERRRELVVSIAQALTQEGHGSLEPDGYHLQLTHRPFVAAGKRLFPEQARLLACTAVNLRRARIDRKDSALPAVHLLRGRPRKPTA